jgi:hypothetical protein
MGLDRSAARRLIERAEERGALLAEHASIILAPAPGMATLSLASGRFLVRTIVAVHGVGVPVAFDERVAETAIALTLARIATGAVRDDLTDPVLDAATPLAETLIDAIDDGVLDALAIGRALASKRGGTLGARLGRLLARC